jgi:hypothetical protein
VLAGRARVMGDSSWDDNEATKVTAKFLGLLFLFAAIIWLGSQVLILKNELAKAKTPNPAGVECLKR